MRRLARLCEKTSDYICRGMIVPVIHGLSTTSTYRVRQNCNIHSLKRKKESELDDIRVFDFPGGQVFDQVRHSEPPLTLLFQSSLLVRIFRDPHPKVGFC